MASNINSIASGVSNKLAIDSSGLNDLKLSAKEDSPEAIKGVAKQFEAIFMNMMLKSMRDATPQDSPFDSEQSRQFTAMLDQQLSSSLSAKGMGLADVLVRQLSKTANINAASDAMAVSDDRPRQTRDADLPDPYQNDLLNNGKGASPMMPLDQKPAAMKPLSDAAGDFQNRMAPHAEAASRATGVPANFMLGQAALESGWGKRELKGSDGTPSNNLFGIKATGGWTGKTVTAATTEYVHGVKQLRMEKFRAYDSYADSFKDFANMMRNNPRYENVMSNLQNVNDYARAMQSSGYATDPAYAEKLAKVIQKVTSA